MKNFIWIALFSFISLYCTYANADNVSREVSGWYNDGWNAESHASYMNNSHIFSEINPYWYDLGTLVNPTATDGSISERAYAYTPQNVIDAHNNGDLVIPAMADHASGQINSIINNPTARTNLINNIINTVQNRGYDGFDLNFEAGTSNSRAAFTSFINDLSIALHANGKKLSVTVKAVVNTTEENWYIFDLSGLGNSAVDRIKIMAYDKNFDAGANVPGPIAPINWVRNVLTYTITTRGVPSTKIQLGLHNYAWTWKKVSANSWQILFPHDTYEGVQDRCPTAVWQWNANALESWKQCTYAGKVHKSFVGTADTIMARVPLADEFNLAGIAFWVLGKEDSSIYPRMCTYFGSSCNPPPGPPVLLSQNKPVTASSSFDNYYTPVKSVDGDLVEGWIANPSETTSWIYVDLQATYNINQVKIYWGGYDWSITYQVQQSSDGINWTTVFTENNNANGGIDIINLNNVTGRYIRLLCLGPKSDSWSYEVYEFQIFGNP